ncbi:MAG: outer membrane beta-barrel family protein [Prevotellaceae bacterium]|nr:outer membrane beta-barrel family protein [Prevotellaceae bacterium]
MKYLTFNILIFVSSLAMAQSIKTEIKVLSVDDFKPVADAKICFADTLIADTVCYYSNEDGALGAELRKGIYNVSITASNFEDYEDKTVIDGSQKTFYLWGNKIVNLDEAVVTARRKNLSRSFGVTTLTVNNDSPVFQNAQFSDIIGIIPGVMVNSSKISILGKTRILYLVNGRETSINVSQLQTNQIDKIEVMSNPSAKYQANYDAVINIVLLKNEKKGYSANIYTSALINSKYSHYSNVELDANFGKLTFEGNFSYFFDNGKVNENGWQMFENVFESFQQYHNRTGQELEASATLTYEMNKFNQIGASINFSSLPKNSSTTKTESSFYDLNNKPDSLIISFNNQNVKKNALITSVFHVLKNKKNTLSSYFSFFDVKNLLNNKIDSYNGQFNSLNQNVLSNEKNKTYIINSDYEHNFNDKHKVQVGGRFIHFEGKYSLLNTNFQNIISDVQFDFKEDVTALYAIYLFEKSNFNFSLGARYEYFFRDVAFNKISSKPVKEGDFFPSLSIGYKTDNKLHFIDLTYTKKIQRPVFSQITPFEYNYNYNTIFRGNPNLKNEIINSFQVSYKFKDLISIMPYLNYFDNYTSDVKIVENNETIWYPSNYKASDYGAYIYNNFTLLGKLIFYSQFQIGMETNRGSVENHTFNKSNFKFGFYLSQSFKLNTKFSVTAYESYTSKQISDFTEQKQGFRTDISINYNLYKNNLKTRIRFNDIFNTFYNINEMDIDGLKSYRYSDWSVRGVIISLQYNFQWGKKSNTNAVKIIDNTNEQKRVK